MSATAKRERLERERYTEQLRTNLSPAQAQAVEQLAAEHEVSVAAVIRRAVVGYISAMTGSNV